MKKLYGILITAFLLCPQIAAAQINSYVRAVDLLSMCKVESDSPKACMSYISGVIDYHNLLIGLDVPLSVRFCIPERYTLQQVTTIVLKDLANSPQHDHFTAAPAVALSLQKVFPCKSRKKKK